jgi:hypothetical protein
MESASLIVQRVDMDLVPLDLRPLVYQQQLERFLKSFDRQAHLRYTIILLRLMARARGIESFSGGYLSPSLLHLFVYRYYGELCDEQLGGVYSEDKVDHFNLARYVCIRLCEFDYRNMIGV